MEQSSTKRTSKILENNGKMRTDVTEGGSNNRGRLI